MAIMNITSPVRAARLPHKYLDLFGMVWVTFLVLATLTAAKTFAIGPLAFSVSVIAYPVTYIFADIFTEVYGYAATRRIVWTGLICLMIASCLTSLYAVVPPDPSFADNDAYRTIFMGTPALAVAGILCFFSGEFVNSFVMAKMKVMSEGRFLHLRLISSTFAGQMADNIIFYSVAHMLGGFYDLHSLPNLVLSTVAFCTLWEFCALPLTGRLIRYLKREEGIDVYDRHTNFNPFALKA